MILMRNPLEECPVGFLLKNFLQRKKRETRFRMLALWRESSVNFDFSEIPLGGGRCPRREGFVEGTVTTSGSNHAYAERDEIRRNVDFSSL